MIKQDYWSFHQGHCCSHQGNFVKLGNMDVVQDHKHSFQVTCETYICMQQLYNQCENEESIPTKGYHQIP